MGDTLKRLCHDNRRDPRWIFDETAAGVSCVKPSDVQTTIVWNSNSIYKDCVHHLLKLFFMQLLGCSLSCFNLIKSLSLKKLTKKGEGEELH